MLSFSQRVVTFISFIITLLGLAGIATSIWLLVTSFNWSAIVSNFQSTLIIIFIVVSVLVFVTGILGLCGACYANTCCLGFFSMLLVLWVILFLVAGVLSFVFPKVVLDRGCDTSRLNIQELKERSILSQQTLCRTCQCYFQHPRQLYLNTSINPNMPAEVTQCAGWQTTYADTVLEQLQKRFGCSGWCSGTQGEFFKFIDINKNGVPTKACFDAFSNWFKKYGVIIGAVSFSLMGILFIMTFVAGCATSSIREERVMRKQVFGGY